jgi:DNA sulfur modification protein DndD
MRIKKVTLNNFRIYKGENTIHFNDEDHKNIHLVIGENGFGKTTFLTSLVWCLYGNGMQDVEDVYRKYISQSGGYKHFLQNSLNKLAGENGESNYFVEIILEGVNIPGIQIDNVTIRRSVNQSKEQIDILIDGDVNELVSEIGKELFIQDFILPKEIAKFFFFDAEKITSLAELKSIDDKRKLSKAYSEVLGIKKYEDLKSNLLDIKYKYKKEGASDEDRNKLEKIDKSIKSSNKRLKEIEIEKNELIELKQSLLLESEIIQEKLIRIGTNLSANQLDKLRKEKRRLTNNYTNLRERLSESLELAPFAMMAKEFYDTLQKAKKEIQENNKPETVIFFKKKIEASINLLSSNNNFIKEFGIKQPDKFFKQFKDKIILDLLSSSTNSNQENPRNIIDLSGQEMNEFEDLFLKIKHQYKSDFDILIKEYRINQSELSTNRRTLISAESKENDGGVLVLRDEKNKITASVSELESNNEKLVIEGAHLSKDIASMNRVKSELENRLGVGEQFKSKNDITERLINEIDELIVRIKEEKKLTLEKGIKDTLCLLMHKKNFVNRVEVLISNDLIDINLYDNKNKLIGKEDLSKGEQQLYATSILKALVDESNIEFPVFIDSPLQKLDPKHARNVINDFYPIISKQVIIIPLLERELNEKEFNLMKKNVCDVWIIENLVEDLYSTFTKIKKSDLFNMELQSA